MIKIVRIVVVFCLFCFTTSAQIEISEDSEAVKAEKKKEKKEVSTSVTEAFAYANWSSTNRVLVENKEPYGGPLGKRADENPITIWSYGLGIRSRVHRFISWEGGISLIRNGESYLFEDVDTSFTYTTTYSYVGMPLKVLFTYGENIRLYAGVGIVPQLFVKYKQEQEWTTPANHTGSETIETNSGYNSFVLSGVANIGVQMKVGESMSLFLMPEIRYQLTSSYEKQDDFVHKAIAYGANIGLTYKL